MTGGGRARGLGASLGPALGAAVAATLLGYSVGRFGIPLAAMLILLPLGAFVLFERPFVVFAGSIVVALAFPYTIAVGTSEAAGFRIAAAGALAAAVVYALRTRARVRLNYVDFALAAFLGMSVASWIVSGEGSAKDTLNPLLPCAFYVAARTLSPERIWQALWVIAGAGVIGASSVLYEFFVTKAPLFVPSSEYLWNSSAETIFRPGGVYGSPPGAVVVLTMTVLCTLPLIARHRGLARVAAAGCIAFSTAGAVATFTRAGLIGLAAGFVVYSFLSGSRALSPRRVLVGATVVTVLLATVVLPKLETNTFFQQGVIRPGNLTERGSYWSLAAPLIVESRLHLAVGHGFNSLIVGRPGVDGTIGAGLSASPTLSKIGPHNQYVRTLLELGLIGSALMLVWLVGAPARAAARVRGAPALRPVVAGLAGAVAAFMVAAFANDALRHPPSVAMAALVTGMLVALSMAPARSEDRRSRG
jgi:hypothetical protein